MAAAQAQVHAFCPFDKYLFCGDIRHDYIDLIQKGDREALSKYLAEEKAYLIEELREARPRTVNVLSAAEHEHTQAE